jgi:hypothetical protein
VKVRNLTGRQLLVPDQKFVAPGPDFVTVKDTEDVQALVAAGALEVDPKKTGGGDADTDDQKETA